MYPVLVDVSFFAENFENIFEIDWCGGAVLNIVAPHFGNQGLSLCLGSMRVEPACAPYIIVGIPAGTLGSPCALKTCRG